MPMQRCRLIPSTCCSFSADPVNEWTTPSSSFLDPPALPSPARHCPQAGVSTPTGAEFPPDSECVNLGELLKDRPVHASPPLPRGWRHLEVFIPFSLVRRTRKPAVLR